MIWGYPYFLETPICFFPKNISFYKFRPRGRSLVFGGLGGGRDILRSRCWLRVAGKLADRSVMLVCDRHIEGMVEEVFFDLTRNNTQNVFSWRYIYVYIYVYDYIYIHLFIVMMTGLQFPHHAIPVGRCGWLNMYPFKSWSFLVTVTSFLEVPWVLIEILSMIFFSICRGEFITRKSYLSTSNSRLLDCGWKVEHVANVKINRKSLTRIGNNERSFPLKSFMKTTIQVNYSVFLIKEVWPTSSLGLTSTF